MSIPTVLVLPYPAQGHVNPMMTLSQKLVEHGCKVIFVNTDFNHKRVLSSMMEQQDHSLDESPLKLVSISDGLGPDDDRHDWGKLCDAIGNTMPAMLEKLIEDNHLNSDNSNRISFIIADLGMIWALEVGRKFGIKGAIFFPMSATMFALLYNSPKLIDDGIINSDGLILTATKTIQLSPSIPEMDTGTFFWLNLGEAINSEVVFNYLSHCARNLNLAEWWFCNTTYELEPEVLTFVPKLLPIGPLLTDNTNSNTRSLAQFWEEDVSCMSWLDQQPHCSVTYVAFGSIILFDQNQFSELALGLDLTNRPFLWVLRQDNKMAYPDEFKGHRGKIVGWSPQQQVLNHPAIACFVSHCGWNSTLEGLCNGVPFLCWPCHADQIYNKTYICDELKVGLGLNLDENGLVSRWEIKKKLDQLLTDEHIRSRSLKVREKVMHNQIDRGRSLENLNKLVKWLKE